MIGAPEVTTATWDAEVLRAEGPVLVEFRSPTCLPCRAIAPLIAELAAELAGRVRVVQCDVTANPDLADRYQLMKVPALLVFRNGEVVERLAPGSRGELRAKLEAWGAE